MTIILIYEYNVIAEARRTSHKSNWLDLMNNSADGPTLQERFNKANINIDKTTLKLLPILLKALNQNKYVEKIIEETTTLYPSYERRDTTDVTYAKHIFSDSKNWKKIPNSRLYTIEYKTSPIVYFKNPTRNIDYFTKIRKIRDYQRIMNYVDKMISEKNLLVLTQPMRRDPGQTDNPIKMTKPMRKHKLTQTVVNKQTTTPKTMIQDKKSNCKCPVRLGKLMHKLLASIQHLLLYFSTSNAARIVPNCTDSVQTRPLETVNDNFAPESYMVTKNHDFSKPEVIKSTSTYKNFLNRHKYNVDAAPTNHFGIRRDYTVNTIMNLLKPNFNKNNHFDTKLKYNEVFSTTNDYVESSHKNSFVKEASTESILKYITDINMKAPTKVVTTVADFILQNGIYDVSPDPRSSLSTFSDTDFTTDDDYYGETTANLAHGYDKLDTHSLELVKSKIITKKKNYVKEEKPVTYQFKGARTSQNDYNNIESMRKVGNLVLNRMNNSKSLSMFHRFAPILKQILKSTTTKTTLPPISTIKPTEKPVKTETKPWEFSTKSNEYKKAKSKQSSTEIMLAEKIKKPTEGSVSKEITLKHIEEEIKILNNDTRYDIKHIEEEIKKLNNETITDQTENFVSSLDNQWELVKIEENSTSTKSMIPLSRSTYLEMQRNDWKHDENHDYDTNMNNYIYDF